MAEQLEEKTSDITPDTVDSVGVKRLKKKARCIQHDTGCKLAEALEQVATQHGFNNWNNVHRFASKRPNSSQITFETNEIWDKTMFVEIKNNGETYISHQGSSHFAELSSDLRVNLSQFCIAEFMSGSYRSDVYNGREVSFTESRRGVEHTDDAHQCNVLELWTVSSEFSCAPAISFLFSNKGDYHRVKRSIDDLTAKKPRR